MKTRGKGKDKEYWISICSAHKEYDENCSRCQSGRWKKLNECIFDPEKYPENYDGCYREDNDCKLCKFSQPTDRIEDKKEITKEEDKKKNDGGDDFLLGIGCALTNIL